MTSSEQLPDPESNPPKVPSLIDDYRTQREAWRAQARDLVKLREQVLAAAGCEARQIVATARTEVGQVLLKARRELMVLAAQVQAATNTDQDSETSGASPPADIRTGEGGDRRSAHEVFAARRDVRWILDEARPDFEALVNEATSVRGVVWLRKTLDRGTPSVEAPTPSPPSPPATAPAQSLNSAPHRRPRQRSSSAVVAAFVVAGLVILTGTVWWLRQDRTRPVPDTSARTEPPAGPASAPLPPASPAASAAPAPEIPAMTFETRRDVWLRTTVDGYVVAARLFGAGETQQIFDAREVSIRAGDAGAVFVSIHGGEALALGRDGQVLTRRFVLDPAATPHEGAPGGPTPPAEQPPGSVGDRTGDVSQGRTQATPSEQALAAGDASADRAHTRQGAQPVALEGPTVDNSRPRAGISEPAPRTEAPDTTSALPGLVNTASLRDTIAKAAEHWLDAYYRQDAAAMQSLASPDFAVVDERADNERLPRGVTGVRRALDEVGLQVFGENALFTARVTERGDDVLRGRTTVTMSFVSQIWARRAGRWELDNIRIVGASALSRMLR